MTEKYAKLAKEPTTIASYDSSLSNLSNFVHNVLGLSFALPVSSENIGRYVTYMFEKGYKVSYIRSNLSGIGYFHKIKGLHDPSDCFLVTELLKGLEKLRPSGDTRMPIQKPLLFDLLKAIEICAKSPYQKLMFSAMSLLAYYALLRVGEVTKSSSVVKNVLGVDQVSVYSSSMIVFFKNFKFSKGKTHKLRIHKVKFGPCPVDYVTRYLLVRPKVKGPLFCKIDGSFVSRDNFVKVLKTSLAYLNIDSSHFNTHSFRIGRCTDLSGEGYSEQQIKLIGRWNSSSYRKYVRPNIVNT